MFLSFRKNKENTLLWKFEGNLKGPLFLCQKCVDQKYL